MTHKLFVRISLKLGIDCVFNGLLFNEGKFMSNKKVLLRERKGHTARRVASACYADLSRGRYPISGLGGYPIPGLGGYPVPCPGGETPSQVWGDPIPGPGGGTQSQVWGGTPPTRPGMGNPPKMLTDRHL